MAPRLVALEEHYFGQAVLNSPAASAIPASVRLFMKAVGDKIADLGESRISMMNRGATSIQVVSHLPIVVPPEVCRAVNDQLAGAVQSSAGRLRGFAFLPMGSPEAITQELERCVTQLDFLGALIPNHAHGRYYDDPDYWPMFAKAEELDVPIYIHPAPAEDFQRFAGNYSETVQSLIAGPAFSWHADVAQHMLRLYGSGLFDAHPRIKIILGHNGETLPYMLDRIDKFFSRKWGGHKRGWMEVWNENVWITTSGMFHLEPLRCCLSMCRPERVLYSKFVASSILERQLLTS